MVALDMAPGSLGIRAFWWASGGNIILILHLVGGSRVPNGITVGSLFIDCLPAYSYGEFSQKVIIYQCQAENRAVLRWRVPPSL